MEARFYRDKTSEYWYYKFAPTKTGPWTFTRPLWLTKQVALVAWNSHLFNNVVPELDAEKNAKQRAKDTKPLNFPKVYMTETTTYQDVTTRYDNDLGRSDLRQGHLQALETIARSLRLTRSRHATRMDMLNEREREFWYMTTLQDADERQLSFDAIAMYDEYIRFTTPLDQQVQVVEPVQKGKSLWM